MVRKILFAVLSTAMIFGTGVMNGASAQQACFGIEDVELEISGTYTDNFAGFQSVGNEAWVGFGSGDQLIFHVCSVDNEQNYLIAQNSAGNDYNPNMFSRFEWFGMNGQLYYCQQVYDAASASEAADFNAHPAADTSNVNDEGCGELGQHPWSQLILIRR